MSLKKINNMLKDGMKKIIIESEISEPTHIAKMIITDVSRQMGSPVFDIKSINNGATGRFGISEIGDDGTYKRKGVSLKVLIGEGDISVDVMKSGKILNSFSGLRDMADYMSLIDTVSRSIQSHGISK